MIAALVPLDSASAFEIFGFHLFGGGDKTPPPPDAVTYSVDLEVIGDDSIRKTLLNASTLEEEKGEPSPGSAALLSRARADYQHLLAALYTTGHYGGTISITVDGREAANTPIDAELGDSAEVKITVASGPQYHFDDVTIVNRPGPIPDDHTVPQTPEELGLVDGAPALSGVILASESSLVGRWREKGHPKAAIEQRTVTAYNDRDRVGVDIVVAPGRSAVFGGTTVTGTSRMDPGFVAWYAGIVPGEPFDPDDLERARDQLRRLDVFQASRIIEGEEILPDGSLPIEISVAERKRRVFGFGAKYSTIDGVGLEGYWRHRNLFGRAEKLGVEARVGGIDAEDPDQYNYRLAVNFLKPGVFTPYTDFASTLYAEQERPDTYRSRAVGLKAGLSHRIGRRLTLEGYGLIEASTIDETTVGDGDFLWFGLPAAVRYDGSDNALNPTRGFRVNWQEQPFYEAGHGNFGFVSEVEGTVYRGFGGVRNDRVVLAGRVALGSIYGPPLDDVPANRLFFAGGGGSIRGYPYRGVGPINKKGDVIGGRSYFVGSVEARVNVTQSIGVVPFMDFGNAFRSEFPDFSERLRFAVGAGLRYNTGLGPLRFDVAVPLDPIDGDPSVAFYIGIGQAF
ncbi:autotransporter assembly complex protein TamA [Acuticoccus mangrovi]|uniref:Outer membrane protein assembly factor n=1 Tax=Acuticoccus mangrovi TaxID=2796142 RepID=A0A934MIB9_9HYPH|nr:autotransporter assembly complex family protein [Acuticoccus mangrovi]MBJ3778603.1 outer membrane protein assembly factor [Acuticoccus mangrovi]